MTYDLDVMFNVEGLDVDQAIVAFDPKNPLDVEWPIDAINEALYYYYDVNDNRGWLFPVIDDGGCIGYIVASRDETVTEMETYQAFVEMLAAGGFFNTDTLEFTKDVPFAVQGEWDGETVGIVAYPQRYGPKFPHEAVSKAIWRLTGQRDWPESKQLWLYPVRRANSSLMSGLIIQSKVDGVGDNDLVDDALYRDIARQNDIDIQDREEFKPERLTVQ